MSPATGGRLIIPTTSERPGKMSTTIAYYVAFVALGLSVAVLGPTLPGLAEQTQSHLSQISYLFTAHALGYLLGSLQAGQIFDRVRGHPVMAAMLLVMAAALALIPLMPMLWLLIAAVLILGMAGATLDVGANALLVWIHGRKVGPYMNGLHFAFGVGAFLTPIVVAQLVLISGDITWAYWALALLMVPAAVWLARLPSPTRKAVSEDGSGEEVNHLLLVLIVIFFALYVGTEAAFGGWIFTYTVAQGLGSKTVAAYLTSAFWGSFTLGRLLAVPIALHVRPRYILAADLAGCVVSVLVILLWPQSMVAIWGGTLGLGLSMASVFPVTITLAERRMTITGRVTSWFFVGASLGGMSLPWLIGQLFEPIGPQVTMYVILIALIIAVAVFAVLIQFDSTPGEPGRERGT